MIGRLRALRQLVFMSACSAMLAPAFCFAAFDVIAEYNDASPDGNGYLVTFTRPALSNTDQVAFLSLLQGTQNDENDNVVLIRGNSSALTAIAHKGVTLLDGQPVNNFLNNSPSIHDSVVSHMADRSMNAGKYVALRGNGGVLQSFLHVGSASPAGNNSLDYSTVPVYSNAGSATYRANYVGSNGETGVYSRAPDGTVTTHLREFTPAPRGGTIYSLDNSLPTINESGQIAATAGIVDGPFSRKSVIRVTGGTATELVRDGDALSDGVTVIGNIASNAVPINDSGQIAFAASYSQNGGATQQGVFFAGSGNVALATPATLPGQAFPITNLRLVNMNNAGAVAMTADFGFGGDPVGGVYVVDSQGTQLIALEDTATPSGGNYFRRLVPETISLNENGQVAFVAELSNTVNGGLAGRALYSYVPTQGLQKVLGTGDAFAGSTVTALGFSGAAYTMTASGDVTQAPGAEFSGLNDSGKLAFTYSLANGSSGIALWSPASAAVPGDYNGNGVVDAADYTLWRDHLGQSFTLNNENPSALTPGTVDQEDYDFWKANFGLSAGAGSVTTSVAVPEPMGWLLMVVGWISLPALRRRK